MAAAAPPAGRHDPPRASLVLLARNQERYVGEAVASVLAQDYPNLQIVLSDHDSTDGTLAIMAGAAGEYRGPHDVLLNRSASPLGVLGHALEAVALTDGSLIVAAAGDDIALPHRVTRLVERWRQTGAAVLSSASETIDEAGCRRGPAVVFDTSAAGSREPLDLAAAYFPGRPVPALTGASAAYDRAALDTVAPPPFPVIQEDFFLTMMLALRGARFAFVDEPLLLWRRHPEALSLPPALLPTLADQERGIARWSEERARILRHVEAAAATGSGFCGAWGARSEIDLKRLRMDAAFHEALARWRELGLRGRLAALAEVRGRNRRSLLARLFGPRYLAALKRLRPTPEACGAEPGSR